jgi:NADH:ubiquinone oxidoreductase subunit K
MEAAYPLVFAALLFSVGVYGVLSRRNAVLVLMSVELMLASATINLVAFGQMNLADPLITGQVFALFVIAVGAAEVGIGLAIILLLYRNRASINIDDADLMKY